MKDKIELEKLGCTHVCKILGNICIPQPYVMKKTIDLVEESGVLIWKLNRQFS